MQSKRVGKPFWVLEEEGRNLTRNNVIFRNQEATVVKAVDDVKFRVAWWFKYYGKGNKLLVALMLLNIKESCISSVPMKKGAQESWKPPDEGCLKFNVDGSARGRPGPAGIGGVLRNSMGFVMCQFSISVGSQEPNSAEVLAILKACKLCAINSGLSGYNIQVVSDSMEAISWVNNLDDFGNLSNLETINDISGYLSSVTGLSVIYNSRESNADADRLAKRSSRGGADFVEWFGL